MRPERDRQDGTPAWGVAIILAIGFASFVVLNLRKTRRKVFVSYDHDIDVIHRRLLSAWNANNRFELEFDETSPLVAINSTAAGPIKSALTKRLKQADVLLVIVGKRTHKSSWVKWEIERAKESDIRLALSAVKIDRESTTPPALLNAGTTWAMAFTHEALLEAISNAKVGY
jgi:antiphage defense system Thoeris ThsB-like protein